MIFRIILLLNVTFRKFDFFKLNHLTVRGGSQSIQILSEIIFNQAHAELSVRQIDV